MTERKYVYADDSWYDGSDDCPCCSGLGFECYNLTTYPEHVKGIAHHYTGSVSSDHELLRNVLMMECGVEYVAGGNPYDKFTLQELKDAVERCGVEVEIVDELPEVPDVEIEYQEDDGNSNCDGGGCTI